MNSTWREQVFAVPSRAEACQYKPYPAAKRISEHRFAAGLILFDAVALFLAGLAPATLYGAANAVTLERYLAIVMGAQVLFLLIARSLNLYRTHRIFDWKRALTRALTVVLLTFFALMLAGIAFKITETYSRVWFFSWFAATVVSVAAVRILLLSVVEARLTKGACLQRALIVNCGGNSFTGQQLALETRNRIRAVGKLIAPDPLALPDLTPYLRQLAPELVILNLPLSQLERASSALFALSHHAVDVLVLPQESVLQFKILRLRQLGTQTFLQIAEPPLGGWNRAAKRLEDLVVASLALVVASPVLLLTALAIKLESKGPILFKQPRAGFNNNLIEVWKFRSMYVDGTDLHASRQTSKDDPRVTRVGRFIRRTSIDELPQFWNVLQGSMSVVGPRPHALSTTAEGKSLDDIVDAYAARHRVKPGVTGWAQINGARGELQTGEQVQKRVDYDLHYIENWSVFFDLKIILMTVVRVFYDPRAY